MDFSVLRNKNRIIWSQDQINYIINDYSSNLSTTKLAKEFNVTTQAIRKILQENNVDLLSLKEINRVKFPRNSFAFNIIDENSAYWIGFLCADGTVLKNNEIRISLNAKDIKHIEKFKNFLNSSNTISTGTYGKEERAYFSIRDEQIAKDLADRGCINNKTYLLKFPNEQQIPEKYLSHFIRGYFDGDGSINYSFDKKYPSYRKYRIGFVGTEDFLKGVRHFFDKDNVKIENHKTWCQLNLSGNKSVIKYLNLIYNDSTENNRLDRKYNSYIDFIKYMGLDGEPINIGCNESC